MKNTKKIKIQQKNKNTINKNSKLTKKIENTTFKIKNKIS